MQKTEIRKIVFGWLLLVINGASSAEEMVTVAWRIKPPHQYLENGIEKGNLLERAKQVFTLAHITTHFVEEPAKRIWNNFGIGTKNYCSFGWYKTPEREQQVQFSAVFHSDPPHTLLVSVAALPQVSSHRTLSSLMADRSLTIGVVDAVSYGMELDSMIKSSKNKIERSTTLPMNMARMVAANRASYMLIDREDWEYLKDKEEPIKQSAQLDLSGMPAGLNRYIVCSKDIPTEQMVRINAAIQKVNAIKKPFD
jgi:polar amino acid transport system substrate-binding protein